MTIKLDRQLIFLMKPHNLLNWIFALMFLGACQNSSIETKIKKTAFENKITQDKIVEGSNIEYAQNFDIQYFEHYKLLTVRNSARKSGDSLQYILLEKNAPKPKGFQEHQIIRTPVQGVICLSATQISIIDELEKVETIIGVSDKNYVMNPKVQQQLQTGKTLEFGQENTLNEELILSTKPDVILMSSGVQNSLPILEKMQKTGVKILINADWLETTPLGRAEWLKLYGILYNIEKKANLKFSKIEKNYKQLKYKIGNISRPTVITNVPYKGTWYMAGGKSYVAHFLADAGANYVGRENTEIGSIPTDFETIYKMGLDADFWINLGTIESKEMLLNQDKRLADFKAFQQNNLYNYTARLDKNKLNEYFANSIINPDKVLADLIAIFHPHILPDHQFYYYKKLN